MLARFVGDAVSAALPLPPSGGLRRLIARSTFPPKVIVFDDEAGRPHSHRPHDASVAHGGGPRLGGSTRDLTAPVRAGAVLSGEPRFYQHSRLRLQAMGGCALAYAFLFLLPHQAIPPSSRTVSHGGLIKCGQNQGSVAA